jgi:hypothetical protein
MRLSLLAFILLGASASAAAAQPQSTGDMPVVDPLAISASNCPPISRYEALMRGKKEHRKFLDELPAADMYNAVYRRVGGCVVPVVVGYGFGSEGSAADRN